MRGGQGYQEASRKTDKRTGREGGEKKVMILKLVERVLKILFEVKVLFIYFECVG